MTMHTPPHPDAREVMSTAAKLFWALVVGLLALLLGGLLLAPAQLISSVTFMVILAAVVALWLLHSLDVRRHQEDVDHDPALHRARERRGF